MYSHVTTRAGFVIFLLSHVFNAKTLGNIRNKNCIETPICTPIFEASKTQPFTPQREIVLLAAISKLSSVT
jgi:hypothetical protein